MKWWLSCLVLVLGWSLFLSEAGAQRKKETTQSGVSKQSNLQEWGLEKLGMSRRELQKTLKLKRFKKVRKTSYFYHPEPVTIHGRRAIVTVAFVGNKLAEVTFYFNEFAPRSNDRIKAFETLATELVETYGKPTIERPILREDVYQNEPGLWNIGLRVGKVVLRREWHTPQSTLKMRLFGLDSTQDIHQTLTYQSASLGESLPQGDSRVFYRGTNKTKAKAKATTRMPYMDLNETNSPTRTRSCCKYCSRGQPCGDSCISKSKTCHKPRGCAC